MYLIYDIQFAEKMLDTINGNFSVEKNLEPVSQFIIDKMHKGLVTILTDFCAQTHRNGVAKASMGSILEVVLCLYNAHENRDEMLPYIVDSAGMKFFSLLMFITY